MIIKGYKDKLQGISLKIDKKWTESCEKEHLPKLSQAYRKPKQ